MQGVSTYGVAVTGVPTAIFAFRDRGDRVVFEGAVVERADIESGSRKCASIDDALSTRQDALSTRAAVGVRLPLKTLKAQSTYGLPEFMRPDRQPARKTLSMRGWTENRQSRNKRDEVIGSGQIFVGSLLQAEMWSSTFLYKAGHVPVPFALSGIRHVRAVHVLALRAYIMVQAPLLRRCHDQD